MKKFSTAGTILAFALLGAATSQVHAHQGPKAAQCEFRSDAPDQHTVVRGDTLWHISGRFLHNPWCWPTVWNLNREQIENPHWIYPGEIIYFDRAAGRLGMARPLDGSAAPVVKLSPGMRSSKLTDSAIPSIPPDAIEPFLSQPLVIESSSDLDKTPRIVAARDGHVFMGQGDKAYVRGNLNGETLFQAFRPGAPLVDPMNGSVLGYEAVYLGTLKLDKESEFRDVAHTFKVETSKEEMTIGDHLVPVPPTPLVNYVPHPPAKEVNANVVAVYGGGLSMAGQYQIVSISRGEKDGIDIGTVLELHRKGRVIADRSNGGKAIKLPDEKYGHLFIFRVFKNVSYGLIMQVTDSVHIGDMAVSPLANQ